MSGSGRAGSTGVAADVTDLRPVSDGADRDDAADSDTVDIGQLGPTVPVHRHEHGPPGTPCDVPQCALTIDYPAGCAGTQLIGMSRRRSPTSPAAVSAAALSASQNTGVTVKPAPGSRGTCAYGERSITH